MRTTPRLVVALLGSLALFACTEDAPVLGGSAHELGGPERWTLCHRTLSNSNPYVAITVSEAGAQAHLRQHTDPRDYAVKGAAECKDGGGDTGGSPCLDTGDCRICEVGCPNIGDSYEGNFCLPKLILICHKDQGGGGCVCGDLTPQCCH